MDENEATILSFTSPFVATPFFQLWDKKKKIV